MNGKKYWVKQLTHAQAEKLGISEPTPLEMVDYENPKTGEKSKVPAGIDQVLIIISTVSLPY